MRRTTWKAAMAAGATGVLVLTGCGGGSGAGGPEAADVQLGATATAGRPQKLFDGPFGGERPDNWDVSGNGREFVMVVRPEGRIQQATLRVLVNWLSRLPD